MATGGWQWSMQKGDWRIECRLSSSGGDWQLSFLSNGEWLFNSCFPTWQQAIDAADDKHDDLERRGWSPAAAVRRG